MTAADFSRSTILDLLEFRASEASGTADRVAFTFLADHGETVQTVSFADLFHSARNIAAHIQKNTAVGDRVLLVYPPGPDFIIAFMGCVLAGVIAVPAPAPTNAKSLPRLSLILLDSHPCLGLSSRNVAAQVAGLDASEDNPLHRLSWLRTDELSNVAQEWRRPICRSGDTVFLQYTSGSTGAPKGVMVSHENILANVALSRRLYRASPTDVVVSWLPPHHDFGLIGAILFPIVVGCRSVHLSPIAFLRRPFRWLKAITEYGGTITGAPNFAYDLCVQRITEEQKKELDLSSLRVVINGAERIRHETLSRFTDAFAKCGLQAHTMTPSYGLAESTLAVSSHVAPRPGALPRALQVSKASLSQGSFKPAATPEDALRLVSVGFAPDDLLRLAIVDPTTSKSKEAGQVGEIWLAGPSIAAGYWNQPIETAASFFHQLEGQTEAYLRTGDLGFIYNDALYVSGRIKETMIFSGRNVYPQDVEATIEALEPGFRENGCAAFSLETGVITGLVIIQEISSGKGVETRSLIDNVRSALMEQHELVDLAAVLLVRAGDIPRTTSGKIQRGRCRDIFLTGAFAPIWSWHTSTTNADNDQGEGIGSEPLTKTEYELTRIWEMLLDAQGVSKEKDFFELGGHSLLATQVVAQVREVLGVSLPLSVLFEARTISGLASHIDSLIGSVSMEPGLLTVAPLAPVDRRAELPLSYSQQRLWFLDQYSPGGSVYNVAASVRLRGRLDRAALAWSLNEVVRRHEALRTVFRVVAGEARQVIQPADVLPLPVVDLIGAEDTVLRAELLSDAQAPFDLARGPLLRYRLLAIGDEEHVLQLTVHHIVADGWSMGVLVREISALYGAMLEGRGSTLPSLPIQYADYAHWQRQWLQGEILEKQLGYWTEQLAGSPSLLSLPTDHPRPAVQRHRGGRHDWRLEGTLGQGLQHFARSRQATLFMALAAGFAAVLSRYAGQDEINLGTVVAHRNHSQTEGLIGFFANTLVLRIGLEGRDSFESLLERVKATAIGAYGHQDLPFERLVEALQPERDGSHAPLFQAMLVLQNNPATVAELPGLVLEEVTLDTGTAKFDLLLNVMEVGEVGELVASLEYDSDLFEARSIEQLSRHLVRLLEEMVRAPQSRVMEVDLLSPVERRQVLVEWNETASPYPQHFLHERFVAQANRTPEAVAVVFEGEQLSYRELDRRSSQLAHRLRSEGVGAEAIVGLCLERGLEMVVAVLGVLKAGGAYLPLDPSYPVERLRLILEEAAPRLVISQNGLEGRFSGVSVLCLDDEDLSGWLAEPVKSSVQPENLAYVIYTSGSTGRPKGVGIRHGSASAFLGWVQEVFQPSWLSHVLASTSLNFDLSVFELFAPLSCGGTVWIVPNVLALTQSTFTAPLTLINTVPSAIAELERQGAIPSSVQVINLAGEALSQALVQQLYGSTGVERIFNLYGPSEDTTYSTWAELPRGISGPVPIGRPIANTQVYLLDEQLNPVPVGAAGELYVAGAGLARGYLGRPGLTGERFVPNPFSQTPGERMYRTGDLARYWADGRLDYLGRIDNQVKIRGFRIELGEIEASLMALPGVREAVVLAREDLPGEKRLVAYVVAKAGATISARELSEQLSQMLPQYMVPAHIVLLDVLPLTSNGKIDRKALPVPDTQALARSAYEAPQTPTEEKIATVWADLLNVERVSRHDNFFALGGHSLLAVRAVEELRQTGVATEARSLFAAATLADLAVRIDAPAHVMVVPENASSDIGMSIAPQILPLANLTQDEINRVVISVPGGVDNIQDIYPLTPLQEGILFHHLMQNEGDTYVLRTVLSFDSEKRRTRFLEALQQVTERHDILRSAMRWEGLSRPIQVVYRRAQMQVQELTLHPARERLVQLMELTDPRKHRIDLTQAPLIAVYTTRIDDAEEPWALALLTHHIATDDVTTRIIVTEAWAILEGQGSLLPVPRPYRDFVAHALSIPASEHESYFRRELGDVSVPTAAFGVLDVHHQGVDMRGQREIAPALAQRLYQTAREYGVSPAALFHLAWAQVTGLCSGQRDVVFGTVLLNQAHGMIGADRALGLFINTLPIRVGLKVGSVEQALRRTQANLSELLQHEQASLALAQRQSSVDPALPLFTSLLNYRHSVSQDPKLWQGMRILANEERTNYPVGMDVDDLGHGFILTAACVPAIDPQRILNYYEGALEQLVQALEHKRTSPISELYLPLPDEEQKLLRRWNDVRSYPTDLLHERFVAQANRTPEAVAVVFEGEQLSYRELDRRSSQLAHRLRSEGVGAEAIVGLCLERGLEMVVAVLGVLKAGGAYLPLDPSYPVERLRLILEEAAPRLVISQNGLEGRFSGVSVLCLDDEDLSGWLAEPVKSSVQPENLAYVIYTSGSTGRPKGVQVTHANATRLMTASEAEFDFGSEDVWTLFHSYAFDFSVWEIWGALLYGGRLVVVPRLVAQSADDFYALLAREGVTVLNQTPSAFQQLIRADQRQDKVLALRHVIFGGEALSVTALSPWFAKYGDHKPRLSNMYGITETTVHVTWHGLTQDDDIGGIGRPLSDLACYLLDEQLNPVPVGAAGELYVAGAGLARGYLGRPGLTGERFVPNPFSQTPGERMYRTGDLARYWADGRLDYLGRIDNQVKIRGFRIELGEIEASLMALPGVREAVVLAREDLPGEKRLVAYVTAKSEQAPSTAELLSGLSRRLPDYMVPAHIVLLDVLPLTSNGKIDRKALPVPDTQALARSAYEAPQTPTEEKIATVWADLLNVERVSRHDNFFALGGHSLLATRLLAKLREEFDTDVPLRAIFEAPTISAQAVRVEEILTAQLSQRPPIKAAPRSATMGLSYAQNRFWFLQQFQPDNSSYAMSMALSIEGRVDVTILRRAFNTLIERHEPLRTIFVLEDGVPRQKILPALKLDLPVQTLSHLSSEDANDVVQQEIEAEAARIFDLSSAPLLRTRLLERGHNSFILLLTIHRILCDGWSRNILIQELSSLYTDFLAGRPTSLPLLPIQYADYSQWEQELLSGEFLADELVHWRAQMQDIPDLLTLPHDRPRPTIQTFRGAGHKRELSLELTRSLEVLAGRHDTTLFMVMTAAVNALLYRWTGQTEFSVGALSANRSAQTEGLIGIFMNILALPARVQGQDRFADLLRQTANTIVTAQEHPIPFELLLTHLTKGRDTSYMPYAQVAINFDNDGARSTTSVMELSAEDGLQIRNAATNTVTHAHFELKFDMELIQGRLHVHYEYNADLFECVTIERLADSFEHLLTAVVETPDIQVQNIPVLSERQHALLHQWNDSARPISNMLLHELFDVQARHHPERLAIITRDRQITYGELHSLAQALGAELQAIGAKQNTLIAVALPKGWEQVVASLGVLYAGAAYLPLDPSLPEQRLGELLQDSEASIVLTRADMLDDVSWTGQAHCITVDNIQIDDLTIQQVWQPRCGNSDLAYVIYTSGSTGKPKGVMIDHRGAVNTVLDINRRFSIGPADRVFALSELTFDLSVFDLFGTLAAGATIVMPDMEMRRDPAQWIALLTRAGATVWNSVPALLGMLLEHVNGCAGVVPATLRLVLLSGDWIPLSLPERLNAILPRAELISLGGATEVSVWSIFFPVDSVDPAWRSIPYGRPLSNQCLYVLDDTLQPCIIGAPGQLYIGGIGVAQGYWRDAEKTAYSFIVHPHTSERLYRTGDYGRYRTDGNIEFLGRRDSQVKVLGYRIELGEIESALNVHPAVEAAVANVANSALEEKRLTAYVVTKAGTTVSERDLVESLSRVLPNYMIPANIMFLEALPLTSNGKIDRKALPTPRVSHVARVYEAPEGPTETAIAAVWANLLSLEWVSRSDNFFALGGHSLLAVRAVEQLRQKGVTTDAPSVFATATLADLAARIDAGRLMAAMPTSGASIDDNVITPHIFPMAKLTQDEINAVVTSIPGGISNVQDIYPLGPLQEGLLFHHLIQNEGDTYILEATIGFDSQQRRERFLQALQQVIERHDILRTAVRWQGLPRPVQVVTRHATLRVQELMLDPSRDWMTQLVAQTDTRSIQLDLTRAPLIGAYTAYAKDIDTPWLLALLTHHMVTDDVSARLIFAEVQAILAGRGDLLPAPQPYRDFVAHALSMPPSDHEEYFRQQLNDVHMPTAVFGLLDIFNNDAAVSRASLDLEPGLTECLYKTARAHSVSPAALFHLAWALVVGICCGRRDVVFGTLLLGRSQDVPGAMNALGMFINTLPIRVRLDDGSIEEVLNRTQTNLSMLWRHEQASLTLAQRQSRVDPALPLFTSLLNYRHAIPSSQSQLAQGDSWQGMRLLRSEERTSYPLNMDVEDRGQAFGLTVACRSTIDPQRILCYLDTALRQLVHSLAHQSQSPISELQLSLPAGEQKLLSQWNETASIYSRRLPHQLFEAVAESCPEAVAVSFENRQLSYAALNQRANRLASKLRDLGVGPDVVVALCAERGVDMVAGVLAILKAGGAYLPLDSTYPRERLAYILDDAQPAVILCHAHLISRLPLSGRSSPVVHFDDTQQSDNHFPIANLPSGSGSHHLAYVIYTSGSTGSPKAVMVTHGSWSNLLQTAMADGLVSPSDRVLQLSSLSFDASAWEIGLALASGARLCIAPSDDLFPGGHLENFLDQSEINVALLPTAVLNALQVRPLPALHTLLVGGEAVSKDVVTRWTRATRRLYNAYGPTETTVYATLHPCDPEQLQAPPIGRPVSNVRTYILDNWMQLVPPEVPGELYVGGEGLARGYLNRPGLTAEHFIPDPISEIPGARMYRTSDLASFRADGAIEYLGRSDRQVKIRGFRVGPEEIEAALIGLPGVSNAAVALQRGTLGDARLVAYVTADNGCVLDDAMLQSLLAEQLPVYMLPTKIVTIDTMPITPQGKIDRQALPICRRTTLSARDLIEPRTPTEVILRTTWSEILDVPSVSIYDNFHDLGGDSLLAVRLSSRAQRYGLNVSVPMVLANPTLFGLANAVDRKSSAHNGVIRFGRQADDDRTVRRPALFIIHGAGNQITGFDLLATELGQDFDVFGVRSVPLEGEFNKALSLAALADCYVAWIEGCHAGPYALAGWSMGGLLALMVTERLEDQGHVVQWVGLIDTHLPEPGSSRETVEAAVTWGVLQGLAVKNAIVKQYLPILKLSEQRIGISELMRLFEDGAPFEALAQEGMLTYLQNQVKITRDHMTVMQQFEPVVVAAPLHVFWAVPKEGADARPLANWLTSTSESKVSTVTSIVANHYSILSADSVSTIAAVLRRDVRSRTRVQNASFAQATAVSRSGEEGGFGGGSEG